MVEALTNDELVHEAPAIVGCQTPSALVGHKPSTAGRNGLSGSALSTDILGS
jgi:hypothetical protein